MNRINMVNPTEPEKLSVVWMNLYMMINGFQIETKQMISFVEEMSSYRWEIEPEFEFAQTIIDIPTIKN